MIRFFRTMSLFISLIGVMHYGNRVTIREAWAIARCWL